MIIVFGGSFDPIHIGHILIARDALERFNAKKVIFVPTYLAPLKDGHSASPEDRYNMVKLAIEKEERFYVDDFEIKKGGISYTVETLRYMKERYKEEIFFLMGLDSFLRFHMWKEPESILKLSRLIVAVRNGNEEKLKEYLNSKFPHLMEGKDIFILSTRRIDISSTEIRRRVKEGKSIYCLVPESVERYIKERGLYR